MQLTLRLAEHLTGLRAIGASNVSLVGGKPDVLRADIVGVRGSYHY